MSDHHSSGAVTEEQQEPAQLRAMGSPGAAGSVLTCKTMGQRGSNAFI